ncbi:unnamed protein product [Diamesa hyperborea]
MSLAHQLTHEGEFRYIVLWFSEWSEYEKIDFLPIIVQWLLKPNEPTNPIIMNGLTNSMASSSIKPMSLFQCRIKLFKDWTKNWSGDMRTKLIDKINELDSDFALKVNQELEEMLKLEDEVAPVVNGIEESHNNIALAISED